MSTEQFGSPQEGDAVVLITSVDVAPPNFTLRTGVKVEVVRVESASHIKVKFGEVDLIVRVAMLLPMYRPPRDEREGRKPNHRPERFE